jgi:hypothetical protein
MEPYFPRELTEEEAATLAASDITRLYRSRSEKDFERMLARLIALRAAEGEGE